MTNYSSETLKIEYNHTIADNEASAKNVNVVLNSGAYCVVMEHIGSLKQGEYLGGPFKVQCSKTTKAKDRVKNDVHFKAWLKFICRGKSCVHGITVHCHHSTQKLQIQGGIMHKNDTVPYFYAHNIHVSSMITLWV